MGSSLNSIGTPSTCARNRSAMVQAEVVEHVPLVDRRDDGRDIGVAGEENPSGVGSDVD